MAFARCVVFTLILICITSYTPSLGTSGITDNKGEVGTDSFLLKASNWSTERTEKEKPGGHGVALWGWQWDKVKTYLVVSLFLLVAALVKVCYHHSSLHSHVPESCILIIVGTLAEVVIYWTDSQEAVPTFNSDVFFFILLPPIILESAYSLHNITFFNNIGTVLLLAVAGTLINIFLVAPSLYFLGYFKAFGSYSIPSVECLVFATLICAVDPVAVLAIFQDLGVNKALYFLVFGESLLNDAVVITLYNMVSIFAGQDSVTWSEVVLGMFNFLTVSCGGLFIGIIFGLLTALITRVTSTVRVVEPLIVIVLAYLSYVGAELFHFSGIIGLIGCGLMQAEYAMHNISLRSATTIKYFTKTISSVSDVIIFFFLGKVLIQEKHEWNTSFIFFATLFCVIYRFLTVFVLTYFANNCFQRLRLINFEEQVLMAYGGLRGAIAFSLAVSLNPLHIHNKDLFITTTLFVILFTVFVMGSTTQAVVKLLRVRTEEKQESKMFLVISTKQIETYMAGFEAIAGQRRQNYWFQKWNRYNDKYLKRYLIEGGVNTANGLIENFERINRDAPESSLRQRPSFRRDRKLTETEGPESAHEEGVAFILCPSASGPEPTQVIYVKSKWGPLRTAIDVTHKFRNRHRSGATREEQSLAADGSEASPKRKGSFFDNFRRNSSLSNPSNDDIRRELNSALSQNAYYQLPGSI